MRRFPAVLLLFFFLLPLKSHGQNGTPASTDGVSIRGTVFDPDGKPVARANVDLATATETLQQSETDDQGHYSFTELPAGTYRIAARAPGLAALSEDGELAAGETRTIDVKLSLSAVDQHVVVSASLGDVLETETGSSVSVVTAEDITSHDAQTIPDVLSEVPGVAVADSGRRGGVTSVFVRGGDSNYNLVMVDGIELNQFGGGSSFDFSPLPTDGVAEVEVVRGAQSALYGSDAVSGVINIVTDQGKGPTEFNAIAEGGSYDTYRIGTGAGGTYRGFHWSYDLMRLDSNGANINDNFRNQSAMVSLGTQQGERRQINFHFFGDASNAGVPGPYGSDPDGLFPGIDPASRYEQNLYGYQASEVEQISPRLRQVTAVSVAFNRDFFTSPPPTGDSFEHDLRVVANTRSEITLAPTDVLAAGFEYNREQFEDTYVVGPDSSPFALPRTSLGFFAEDRWRPANRWSVTAGVRVDDILTAALAPDPNAPRPPIPANTVAQVSPRGSVAYLLRQASSQTTWGATRLHASGGTGIRAPNGFELAFTNNPGLKPERSITADAGVEQRFFEDRATVDVTYFYSRFKDQIVTLGGSLQNLSTFSSANLNNSQAQGVEMSARLQPMRSLQLEAQYTWMNSEVLALDGTTQAEPPFQPGQPLLRRPRNAGSYNLTWTRGRVRLNSNGYARGAVLDLEPNYGAFACELDLPCLFTNHGYILVNAGFGIETAHGVEFFGQLNNILNQKYEEVLGYPAYHLNFMSGIRWHFSPERGAGKHS